jgi:hypothetical protein
MVPAVAALAILACSQGDANPSAQAGTGQIFPTQPVQGAGSGTTDGGARPGVPAVPEFDGGVDGGVAADGSVIEAGPEGGATTTVGTGNGTGGGIPGAAGLGATGTGEGSQVGTGENPGGGIPGGAGLGSTGTSNPVPPRDAGSGTIIIIVQ